MMGRSHRAYDVAKRVLDIAASAGALLVLSPVIGVTALLVRKNLGPPVLFAQERPGLNGAVFRILKFRSMLEPDPANGLTTNEQRLTPFGKRLRATSLDELPSLWNVIRGDMSVVGPRPLRVAYLERYSARQARRHEVRPGLTGLAQVSGRNAISWEERLELDVQYVEQRSLRLDARIVASTIVKVLRREGIAEEGQGAMSAFMGSALDQGLREEPLTSEHLALRVAWLSDGRVRDGISISFTPDIRDMQKWFQRVSDDVGRRDWVYFDDATPVAMCGLSGVGSDTGSLYMYVNPELLGKGYGKRTLRLLTARATSYGIKTLTLETKRSNIAAQALYRRQGFVITREEAGKLHMTKTLEASS